MQEITPKALMAELDKVVIGQEEAKKALSILAYTHWSRLTQNAVFTYYNPVVRLTGLITGPTATGKTLLCETLATLLELPFMKIDASSLTLPGGKGVDIYHQFEFYNQKFKDSPLSHLMNYGIIYIDEFDKLGQKGSDSHQAWYTTIQESLLTIIDGTKITIAQKLGGGTLDTSKMLFIFSGAFEDARKKKRGLKSTIGFSSDIDKHKEELEAPLTRGDIEKAGVVRELLGRVNIITHTNKLSREEIKEVIFNCHDSIYEQFDSLFKLGNKQLDLEEYLEEIIEHVYNSDYGMRYIKSIIYDKLKDQIMELDTPKEHDIVKYEHTLHELEHHDIDQELIDMLDEDDDILEYMREHT